VCVCVCVCVERGRSSDCNSTVVSSAHSLPHTNTHTHISGNVLVVGKTVAGHGALSVNEKTT